MNASDQKYRPEQRTGGAALPHRAPSSPPDLHLDRAAVRSGAAMTRTHCQTARDRNGDLIMPGMRILYLGCKSGEHFVIAPRPVKVVDIHRQGADGTILTCDRPPKPDYPHHFSCTASDTRVVRAETEEGELR